MTTMLDSAKISLVPSNNGSTEMSNLNQVEDFLTFSTRGTRIGIRVRRSQLAPSPTLQRRRSMANPKPREWNGPQGWQREQSAVQTHSSVRQCCPSMHRSA